MASDDIDKDAAKACQFLLADTADGTQAVFVHRPPPGHFPQGAVMENDVGWHTLLAGKLQASCPQRFEKRKITVIQFAC